MHSDSKGFISILVVIISVAVIAFVGYLLLFKKSSPPAPPSQTSKETVKIFLVALEGEEGLGQTFGCKDQLFPVERQVEAGARYCLKL